MAVSGEDIMRETDPADAMQQSAECENGSVLPDGRAGAGGSQALSAANRHARGSLLSRAASHVAVFFSLPREAFTLLFMVFLNTMRGVALGTSRYQFLLNSEYAMKEVEVGVLLGSSGSWHLLVSLVCSPLLDAFGVRTIALVSLSVSCVTVGALAFGSTRAALVFALYMPGAELLGLALYSIGLKQLTTPATRATAFALQVALNNVAIVLGMNMVEALRHVSLGEAFGVSWSGLRAVMLVCFCIDLFELLLASVILTDAIVVALDDDETDGGDVPADACNGNGAHNGAPNGMCNNLSNGACNGIPNGGQSGAAAHGSTSSAAPPPRPVRLTRESSRGPVFLAAPPSAKDYARGYVVGRRLSRGSLAALRSCKQMGAAIKQSFASVCRILRARAAWQMLAFNILMVGSRNQWAAMSTLMITFLTRTFGDAVPAYSIRSLNPTINMLAPWLLAPLLAHLEPFAAILPGLWLFSLSALPMALRPSVGASVMWVVLTGLGEAVWAPRSVAWQMTIAPDGDEALFLALTSATSFVTQPLMTTLNGALNAEFVPDCRSCRDSAGNYCSKLVLHASQPVCETRTGKECSALSELFNSSLTMEATCPRSCAECPGWHSDATSMFTIILLLALSSPVLMYACLPFLRSRGGRKSDAAPAPTSML
uniref:Major facilitator superfamily (MFS) profile domain-containing protein n=1 Tax=Chrysotila carterae TaxID=13221 RepID=A0A7S4B3F4_CHRCT